MHPGSESTSGGLLSEPRGVDSNYKNAVGASGTSALTRLLQLLLLLLPWLPPPSFFFPESGRRHSDASPQVRPGRPQGPVSNVRLAGRNIAEFVSPSASLCLLKSFKLHVKNRQIISKLLQGLSWKKKLLSIKYLMTLQIQYLHYLRVMFEALI